MKNMITALIMTLVTSSISLADTISFQDQGETEYHRGIIEEELDILKGQLFEYLSNEQQCTSIQMNSKTRRKSFFSFKNLYSVSGSANCPNLTRSSMMVDIDGNAASSKMQIIFRDLNNTQIIKTFFTPARGE